MNVSSSWTAARLHLQQPAVGAPIETALVLLRAPEAPAAAAGDAFPNSLSVSGTAPPFDAAELQRTVHEPLDAYLRQPLDAETQRRASRELAQRLLPPPIREALRSLLRALPDARPLMLRLSVPSPALAAIPWEYAAFDEEDDGGHGTAAFLALHPRLCLIREAEAATAPPSAGPTGDREAGQLRVLLVGADPRTERYPALAHAEAEIAHTAAVLQSSPECRSSIRVHVLPHATPAALQRQLEELRPQVLHFVGHGDRSPSGACLILQGERVGQEAPVYADDLARWLARARVRLTVLSACGSPTSHELARCLAQPGDSPAAGGAALTMQLRLRDVAARLFARAFYAGLAEGSSVEESVSQGRQTIQGIGPDWGVPVLYRATSRSSDETTPLCLRPSITLAALPAAHTSSSETAAASPEPQPKPRHNLPVEERPFVGRRREVADLVRKIRQRGERLVTITGIGGMGKTRLAKRAAEELAGHFPDGAWLVECESLQGPADLVAAIYAAVGIGSRKPVSVEQLCLDLAARQMLLVLDCFERITPLAAVIEEVLRAAPGVHCVVTSRVVLGLPREFEYPLHPMGTGARPHPPGNAKGVPAAPPNAPPEGRALAAETNADAIALFNEAAAHSRDNFRAVGKERETVREICSELEGIPLAIVLAASRLRHQTPRELLEQLRRRRLPALRRQRVGHQPSDRHADLQEVIGGSFALLDDVCRRTLRRLTVFVGGFYADAAAQVCGSEEEEDLQDILARLRDNSLVQVQQSGGKTRFRLLDTVREYLTGLDAGADKDGDDGFQQDLAACRRRHAEVFAALADEIAASLNAGEWARGSDLLWTEAGNLRAAMACLIREGTPGQVAQLAYALGLPYFEVGLWDDFTALADAAEKALEREDNPKIHARILGLRGALARRSGREETARSCWLRRLEICRASGNIYGCTDTLFDLATQAQDMQDFAEAKRFLAQAVAEAQAHGAPQLVATARTLQARGAVAARDLRLARTRAVQAHRLIQKDLTQRGVLLYAYPTIGQVYRLNEEPEKAERVLIDACRAALEDTRSFDAARAAAELALLYEGQRRLGAAARAFRLAARIHEELGSRLRTVSAATLARFAAENPSSAVHAALADAPPPTWNEELLALLQTAPFDEPAK